MNFRLSRLNLALAGLMAFPFFSAHADEQLAPVTVSADLRQTKLQDIPASVDVKNEAHIKDQGADHFDDILLKTPNVNLSGQSSHARHLQIRGIGERDEYTGAPNSSVGFAIDDIDFSGIGAAGNLFDVKQIEVLRGPQNTRYGQSAIAGLINIESNEPTPYEEGMFEATIGQDNLKELGIVTSGPLGKGEAAPLYRLSIFKQQQDGFRHNSTLNRDDTNNQNDLNLRGKLRLFPNPETTVDITLLHADLNDGYDAWSRDNTFTTKSDRPGKDTQLSNAGSVKATWTGNRNFVLTSKTGLTNSDMLYSYDTDWQADVVNEDSYYANQKHRRTLYQELRWTSTDRSKLFSNSTDWLAGLYLSHLNESNERNEFYTYPSSSVAYNTDADSDFTHNKLALYTQLNQAVTDKTTLQYSVRIERNQQSFDLSTHQYGDDTNFGGAPYDYTLNDNFDPDETLWGASIHYIHKYNARHTAFAGITRGYKAGGFNAGLSGTSNVTYDAETLYNYEIGLKSNYREYGLQTSTTIFYMDRTNPQFDGYSYEPGGYEWVFFTENLDSAKNYGIETEFDWQLNRKWNLYGSLGLLKTEISGTPINSNFTIKDREQAHAPNYQANLGGKYRSPNGFYLQADITALDAFYFDNSHNIKSKPYHIVDARLGYEAQNYEIYLWGKNLADERYATRGFYFDIDADGTEDKFVRLGDPRQYGVTYRLYF
ncbi:TonB-dependent receptor domain-containing protein [Thiomicrorhabdus sp.]|uniref:TonB-dependent receptor n=1 Tax=Thiomicrorhabdus sp. TaxID=2039724 RepID=UPI0029C84C35|nr:TonB-dependent receptor [Thiomicrorhabdus sp.]